MTISLIRWLLSIHVRSTGSYTLDVRRTGAHARAPLRSFDYYNRSHSLATTLSFRKWFPPDGSRQSERISTWFPRTVRARTFAFRRRSHSVFSHRVFLLSIPHVRLSETRKGNFARKTNTLIRANSQGTGSHRRLFSFPRRTLVYRIQTQSLASVNLHQYPSSIRNFPIY